MTKKELTELIDTLSDKLTEITKELDVTKQQLQNRTIMENRIPKTQEEVNEYLLNNPVKNPANLWDIEQILQNDGLKLPENVQVNSNGISGIAFTKWYETTNTENNISTEDGLYKWLPISDEGEYWTDYDTANVLFPNLNKVQTIVTNGARIYTYHECNLGWSTMAKSGDWKYMRIKL